MVLVTFYLIDTALIRRNSCLVGNVSKIQFIRYSLLVVAIYGLFDARCGIRALEWSRIWGPEQTGELTWMVLRS